MPPLAGQKPELITAAFFSVFCQKFESFTIKHVSGIVWWMTSENPLINVNIYSQKRLSSFQIRANIHQQQGVIFVKTFPS